jgi:HD-like signal output (HDOD) protein
VGQPQFSEGYWQQPDEPARLRYEAAVCSITTLALSQRLAQQWGLPESLQTLIFRQWEPVEQVLEPSYTARTLSLIAAANALAERVVDNPSITAGEVIDQTAYNTLKANLATNRLLDDLHGVWISVRLQRELSVCLE